MCARRWRGGGGCKKNRVKSADSGTKVLDPCCIRSLRGTHDVVFVCVHGCLGVWARAWYLGGLGGRKKTVCFARPSEHSWRADIWWETEKSGTKKKSREGKRERVGLIIGTKVIWGEMHRFTLWRRWTRLSFPCVLLFPPQRFERVTVRRVCFCLALIPLWFTQRELKKSRDCNYFWNHDCLLCFFSTLAMFYLEVPSCNPVRIPVGQLKWVN